MINIAQKLKYTNKGIFHYNGSDIINRQYFSRDNYFHKHFKKSFSNDQDQKIKNVNQKIKSKFFSTSHRKFQNSTQAKITILGYKNKLETSLINERNLLSINSKNSFIQGFLKNLSFMIVCKRKIHKLLVKSSYLVMYLIRKTFEILIIGFFLYCLYSFDIFRKLLDRFIIDTCREFLKLLKQMYIGKYKYIINDVLCDILEHPLFHSAIDKILIDVYKNDYLITYVRNLFYELFSIYLKDPLHGSFINTLFVNLLGDRKFEELSIKFFRDFFNKEEFYNILIEYICEILHDDMFRVYFNYFIKSNLLHFIRKPDFKDNLKDFIVKMINDEYIFERVLGYYYINLHAKEQPDLERDETELSFLFGLKYPYDKCENYLKSIKLDINDQKTRDLFLLDKLPLSDILATDKFDFDPLTLNKGIPQHYEFKNPIMFEKESIIGLEYGEK